MTIKWTLNGARRTDEVEPDETLLHCLRKVGCLSVKCGCETSGCGLCTVWLDGKPVLSCSVPAPRADGREVTTLEGLTDDQVDELFAQAKRELIQIIRNSQDSGEQAIDYLMIAKYFEKVGDHAVNISQWVLFMITGTLEEDKVHDILRGGRS